MADMTLQRIPFTSDNDNRMRTLKARTGITPNLLARCGFCISLEEPGFPKSIKFQDDIGREINRTTLLGQYDEMFIALMKTWMIEHNVSIEAEDEINRLFVDHMNRGLENVHSRVKNVGDLDRLSSRK
jgi:DNA sulfur modification protein DndE